MRKRFGALDSLAVAVVLLVSRTPAHGQQTPCTIDADCNDNNPCTIEFCNTTTHLCEGSVTEGNACQPDNLCYDVGRCSLGHCNPLHYACDDSNSCTDDICNPSTGCSHVNNTAPCEDGNPCTTGDACSGGSCHTGPGTRNCNDNNPCTDDSCDPSYVLGCRNVYNSAPCSDGNPCTTGDACASGFCHPGTGTLNCDDENPCTNDSCSTGVGCVHTNNANLCLDGNACTIGDYCLDGSCHAGTVPLSCDDGNPCTDDSCNPATGCVHANNTAPCTDGSVCTVGDVCDNGACMPGPAMHCDDGNPCTDDSCSPVTGCAFAPNTSPCSDGNACTLYDFCANGSCHAGVVPPSCDDGNLCTDDACDPATGCVHTNNNAPCSDGNACTSGDVCSGGVCSPGGSTNCDDGIACTVDHCDPATGCIHDPSYGFPCAPDDRCLGPGRCSGTVCAPIGFPVNCEDYNPCTADTCDPATGSCSHQGPTCDDGNPCTIDTCTPPDTCVHQPVDCNDGIACTTDSCDPATGACVNADNGSCTTNPKSLGYWQRVCTGTGNVQDSFTQLDVNCLRTHSCELRDLISSLNDICVRLAPHTHTQQDPCVNAQQELLALGLNVCHGRVSLTEGIDSRCSPDNATVGEAFAEADAILCTPGGTLEGCELAGCEAREINKGQALHVHGLVVSRLANGTIRLAWIPPIGDIENLSATPHHYRVWRATDPGGPFVQIAEVVETDFDDTAATGARLLYDVTPVW